MNELMNEAEIEKVTRRMNQCYHTLLLNSFQ